MRIINAETCGHSFDITSPEALKYIAEKHPFSFDCPGENREGGCERLLITQFVNDERIVVAADFHKELSRSSGGLWPEDGEGTFSLELPG